MQSISYGVDIGSTRTLKNSDTKFGWARLAEENGRVVSGTDIDMLIAHMRSDRERGRDAAVGRL